MLTKKSLPLGKGSSQVRDQKTRGIDAAILSRKLLFLGYVVYIVFTLSSKVFASTYPEWQLSQSAHPSTINNGQTLTIRLSFTVLGHWSALEIRDQFAGLSPAFFMFHSSMPVSSSFPNGRRWLYGSKPSGYTGIISVLLSGWKSNPSDTYVINRVSIYDGAIYRGSTDLQVFFNTFTATRTITVSPTRTNTPTPSNTRTVTNTFTAIFTRTITSTITPTSTFTSTRTRTVTSTRSFTPTRTSTFTVTLTNTPRGSKTPTSTITGTPPTSTNTPSSTPTATQTSSTTSTLTITMTHTISPTFTITPTVNLTPIYYYSALDTLIPPKTITITSDTGTFTIITDYDVASDPLVQLRSGPIESYEATITTGTGYVTIKVVDVSGNTVDCSTTPCMVDLVVLRHNTSFPWR